MSSMIHGHFLSDLHLFSKRSCGLDRWKYWWKELQRDDVIVLGGDIFDFRWSRYRKLSDSLDAASDWLEMVIKTHADGKVVYLLGNHDCSPDFQQVLTRLADRYSQFEWHEEVWQFGDCVFLHGDILDAGATSEDLHNYRSGFEHDQPRGPVANSLYEIAIHSRVHRLAPTLIHRPRIVCSKLQRYLTDVEHCDLTAARRIYFGHTHVPMRGHRADHLTFYNSGSGVRLMDFSPHRWTVRETKS